MSGRQSMVVLARQYIDHRHDLGTQFREQAVRVLEFAEYADKIEHKGPITTQMALRWACRSPESSRFTRARRLESVRGFARYVAMFDESTEVPPLRLLGSCHDRRQPHIYSDKEIGQLMMAAAELSPKDGLRPRTYVTLFGLLASTGLRISEALRLRKADVDGEQSVLRVLHSKFRKSRLVALHPSTCAQLQAYERFRDRHDCVARDPDAYFRSERGKTLNVSMVHCTFRSISYRLGWLANHRRPRPRVYDLRHTFACRRLLQWYRDGKDIEHSIASLSTYLGHETFRDTYWYLTSIPELMEIAGNRFERFARHCQETRT